MVSVLKKSKWPGNFLVLLTVVILSAGCAKTPVRNSSPANIASNEMNAETPARPFPEIKASVKQEPVTVSIDRKLRTNVRTWQGTPHQMGGTTRNGVDCSGFVQRMVKDVFDRRIPRSTALQVTSGRPVKKVHLTPGDLVFFRPPHKVRHVGIYLGRSEFAHASSKKGVTISRLDSAYWRNAYWTARRYTGPLP